MQTYEAGYYDVIVVGEVMPDQKRHWLPHEWDQKRF